MAVAGKLFVDVGGALIDCAAAVVVEVMVEALVMVMQKRQRRVWSTKYRRRREATCARTHAPKVLAVAHAWFPALEHRPAGRRGVEIVAVIIRRCCRCEGVAAGTKDALVVVVVLVEVAQRRRRGEGDALF